MDKQATRKAIDRKLQIYKQVKQKLDKLASTDAKVKQSIAKLKNFEKIKKQNVKKQLGSKHNIFQRLFSRNPTQFKSMTSQNYYELYLTTLQQFQALRKSQLVHWQYSLHQYEKQNEITWQTKPIHNWANYMNSYTSAQAQNSSINLNVKAIYLQLLGIINSFFLTQTASNLAIYLRLNLKFQYPQLNSYDLEKKAINIYQSSEAYDTLLLYNQIKTDTDNLNLSNIQIIERPEYLYAWAECFVINTASMSPVQQITLLEVAGQFIKFMIQYQFDYETRNIFNCKLTLGQTTVDYFINKTDVLWVLSEKLFKTKMQYEQKTVK